MLRDLCNRPVFRILSLALVASACRVASRAAPGEDTGVPAGIIPLKGHTETVYAVAVSPDGSYVVTASFDKTLKLWELTTGKEVKTLGGQAGHQNLVLAASFSPDGHMLASGGSDNTARLWDVPSPHFLREYAHNDAVNAMALSPDGLKLAAAGKDGAIRLWTAADGKQLFNLSGHEGSANEVTFNGVANPAGQIVASAGADGTLRLWNPNNGQSLGSVLAHLGPVTGVALVNNVAYTTGADGTLKSWQTPIPAPRTGPAHEGLATTMTLSSDGNQVLSGGADNIIRIANTADGKPVSQLAGASSPAKSIAFSNSLIAAATEDHHVAVWNRQDGKLLGQIIAHAVDVTDLAFSPQNQLFTAGADGRVKIWAMPPVPDRNLAHPDAVFAAAATSDGKHLLTGCADKTARLWNLTNNQMERQLTGHAAAVTAVAMSGNGQVLVTGSADQTIRSWEASNGKSKVVIGAHAGSITALALNAAGTQALSGSMDGALKLWNLAVPPPRLLTHANQVTAVAVSPDGAKLLTGCADKQARLWNLANGQMERAFPGHTLAITSVAFGDGGKLVAAGGADKSLIVWNATDGKEVKKIANLPAAVRSIAFHPTVKGPAFQVAAGLADNSARLYDLTKGKEIKSLPGHKGLVQAVAFLPKGDQLASGSEDGTVQLWKLPGGSPAKKLDYGSPIASIAITADGTRLAAGGKGKVVKIWSLADGSETATVQTPAEIHSVAWSGDGKRLVVSGADNQARVYEADGKLLEFFPHEGAVLAAAFHPDGKQIITGSADKSARVWTPSLLWKAAHTAPVRAAIFTTKGDRVISASDDKSIATWNASDGKLIRSMTAHTGPVLGIAETPDGKRLLSIGAENQVKIWSLAPLKQVARVEDKPEATLPLAGAPIAMTLSPNGTRLAVSYSAKDKSAISVFELPRGQELMSLPASAPGVRPLVFESDNRTLVTAGSEKAAQVHDVGILSAFDAHAGGVTSVAVLGNGNQLLTAGADKTAKLWNLAAGKEPMVAKTFGPFADAIAMAALSRDYTQLGIASGKTVKVWTIADGKETLTLAHPAAVLSLSFSPDKTRIATGTADHLVRVWDVATRQVLQAFKHPGPVNHVAFANPNTVAGLGGDKAVALRTISAVRVIAASAQPIRAMAMTPNASHVLTSDGKEVRLWNAGNGAKEARTFAIDSPVQAIAVSKNNNLVAVGGADKTVRLFQFNDAKAVGQVTAPGPVHRLTFSPNNALLTAACEDHSVATWNVAYNPGQPPPPTFGQPGPVYAHDAAATDVAYAADNMHLYSAGLDHKVRLWKFAADNPTKNFGHPNLVDAVAFNNTGTQLATGCHDGSVRIWDVAKGNMIRQIQAHTTPMPSPVYCVAWNADGTQIVSGSFDHSMKLWNAADGKLIREFKGFDEKAGSKGHREGVFCVAFAPDGKRLISGSSDRSIKFWNIADGTVATECINPTLKATGSGPTAQPPSAHPGWVYSLRFTPDGKYLLSAGNASRNQGYLAIWNATDGKFVFGEELPLGAIYSIAVSPDGKTLALGCGPKGRKLQDTNGYLMKMPAVGQ